MNKPYDPTDIKILKNRLNKLMGQLKAIERMLDDGIGSEELIIQVNAVKSALHSFARTALEKHVAEALLASKHGADTDTLFSECKTVIGRFADLDK